MGTDAGQAHLLDPPYPAHAVFHGAGRYGLQCLANLDQLPPTGSVVVASPLKIQGWSGRPLRVLAFVEGCAMAERSFNAEVQQLRKTEGELFHRERILTVTKPKHPSGVDYFRLS